MKYDPEMDLAYADDATSLEVEIEIVHPETGRRRGLTTDNLTSAMYFMVANNLRPVRESIKEGRAPLKHGDLDPNERAILEERDLPTPQEALDAFREANTQPYTLYVEVSGNPDLVDTFE